MLILLLQKHIEGSLISHWHALLFQLCALTTKFLTNAIDLPAPKTKELVSYLKGLDLSNVLIVFAGDNDNLYMSARNLPNVAVCDYTQVDPVSLLSFEKVLFTVDALKKIEENLAK